MSSSEGGELVKFRVEDHIAEWDGGTGIHISMVVPALLQPTFDVFILCNIQGSSQLTDCTLLDGCFVMIQ
jgi:hypothetical protein